MNISLFNQFKYFLYCFENVALFLAQHVAQLVRCSAGHQRSWAKRLGSVRLDLGADFQFNVQFQFVFVVWSGGRGPEYEHIMSFPRGLRPFLKTKTLFFSVCHDAIQHFEHLSFSFIFRNLQQGIHSMLHRTARCSAGCTVFGLNFHSFAVSAAVRAFSRLLNAIQVEMPDPTFCLSSVGQVNLR